MTGAAGPTDAATRHRDTRSLHWDAVARDGVAHSAHAGAYHDRITEIYRAHIAPGQRVLELGCGYGDLLAAMRPSHGVGVDFSAEMVARARARHPELTFVQADVHACAIEGPFDVVILSDLLNDLWDVQAVLERVAGLTTPHSRVIINFHNRGWEPLLGLAAGLGLARPSLRQNWLGEDDIRGLLDLTGFEVVRTSREVLWPLRTPGLGWLANSVLVHTWPINHLALSTFVVARPRATPRPAPSVSVVVPARNESGNIGALFDRLPPLGRQVELIFVEGHSRDDTWTAIEREIAAHPEIRSRQFRQTGTGKGDAVRLGFSHATGDVLLILDADLTMPPEELPRYVDVLQSGQGEFVNGVRLVYPMEGEAMRTLNLIANRLFGVAFSWLLGQPVKDTLCGTKALWRADYERIAANRSHFGDFDPFGDFDLLFGAARLNLRIRDLPIRYRRRTYGTTNIDRWRHGMLLIRMTWFALWRLKFV